MRFVLLTNMSLDQCYIYIDVSKRYERKQKKTEGKVWEKKILIWGLSLLQNSERTSYEDDHIPVTVS